MFDYGGSNTGASVSMACNNCYAPRFSTQGELWHNLVIIVVRKGRKTRRVQEGEWQRENAGNGCGVVERGCSSSGWCKRALVKDDDYDDDDRNDDDHDDGDDDDDEVRNEDSPLKENILVIYTYVFKKERGKCWKRKEVGVLTGKEDPNNRLENY